MTFFIDRVRMTNPILPFTPGPRETLVTDFDTRTGGQYVKNVDVQWRRADRSVLNGHRVRREESTSIDVAPFTFIA